LDKKLIYLLQKYLFSSINYAKKICIGKKNGSATPLHKYPLFSTVLRPFWIGEFTIFFRNKRTRKGEQSKAS
jgi:hypothetical protein